MQHLQDRTAVVTGAGSGIGRAVSLALARAGCHVAVVDIDADRAASTARDVTALGRRATAHVADVANRAAWAGLVDDVAGAHTDVAILVNNAGVTVYGRFEKHTPAEIDWMLGVNLYGVLHGCHAFLPVLAASGDAHIVNLASMAGLIGLPNQAAYSATKFAVRGFTAGLRIEAAGQGIGVTAILPGAVGTPFMKDVPSRDQQTTADMARLMQKYALSPDWVAASILTGIRRNRPEVVVGPDSQLTRFLQSFAPWFTRWALGYSYRRYMGADGRLLRADAPDGTEG